MNSSESNKMKIKFVCVAFMIATVSLAYTASYGQQNFEKVTHIELNERADFYHVNDRYAVVSDTLFYSTAGFLINSDLGFRRIGDKEYIVIKYPQYKDDLYDVFGSESITGLTVDEVNKTGIHIPIRGKSGRTLMIGKVEFESLSKTILYSSKWVKGGSNNSKYKRFIPEWKNYKITAGFLTIPFKLRQKIDSNNFSLTTDITLAPYVGLTKRISKRNAYYLTVPATVGISLININNNTTSEAIGSEKLSVVPGVTWSTGLILQFDNVNIGIVAGKDYASGIGNDWLYHNKIWYSFAIGYTFLNATEPKLGAGKKL